MVSTFKNFWGNVSPKASHHLQLNVDTEAPLAHGGHAGGEGLPHAAGSPQRRQRHALQPCHRARQEAGPARTARKHTAQGLPATHPRHKGQRSGVSRGGQGQSEEVRGALGVSIITSYSPLAQPITAGGGRGLTSGTPAADWLRCWRRGCSGRGLASLGRHTPPSPSPGCGPTGSDALAHSSGVKRDLIGGRRGCC